MSIISFLNEQKRTIDQIVDLTHFRLREEATDISAYAPFMSYADASLLVARFSSFPTISNLVAQGGELQTRKGNATLATKEYSGILVGHQYLFTAVDYDIMSRMEARLALSGNADTQQFTDYFFGKAESVSTAIIRSLYLLMAQVLSTGACSYVDPLNGMSSTSISYVADTEVTLFPAALAGGNLWSALATANGIENLAAMSRNFYNIHGFFPTAIGMGKKQMRNLTMQKTTKDYAIALRTGGAVESGASTIGIAVTAEDLNNILRNAGGVDPIPPIVELEGEYTFERLDGTYSPRTRFWDENRIVALTDNMAERALVPFPENDNNPGIVTNAQRLEPAIPFKEVVQGMVKAILFISDPRLLSSQVIDT